jgi:hypothetical protein
MLNQNLIEARATTDGYRENGERYAKRAAEAEVTKTLS